MYLHSDVSKIELAAVFKQISVVRRNDEGNIMRQEIWLG